MHVLKLVKKKKPLKRATVQNLEKNYFATILLNKLSAKLNSLIPFCNTNWLHNFYMMMGFLTSSLGESNRISIQNKNIIMETRQVGDK